MLSESQQSGWRRISIASIEDLSDAVLGAALEATQMSRSPTIGSLAFAPLDRGITCTSGYIGGHVALTGPLSASMITLGVGLVMAPGTRHWLNEVTSGVVGVFLPGDEHDALYLPGSMYAVVTLTAERLEEFAAQYDLMLDLKTLGGTGVDTKKQLSHSVLSALQIQFKRIHAAQTDVPNAAAIGTQLLEVMVAHFARPPHSEVGGKDPRGLARVVARARAFIHENLDQPLSIDRIANAAATSHRTLHRAFQIVLDETPYSYVQKLRLNRIHHELVTDAEIVRTITNAAHRWNIPEMGRFAAWYRDLFGELPSQTLARHHQGARYDQPEPLLAEGHRILAASA